MPRKSSVPIEITSEERRELASLLRTSIKKRNWVRADIILRAAEGQTNYMIAKELRLSRNTVQAWRYRFARERLAGLRTRPIPGRPKQVGVEAGVVNDDPSNSVEFGGKRLNLQRIP